MTYDLPQSDRSVLFFAANQKFGDIPDLARLIPKSNTLGAAQLSGQIDGFFAFGWGSQVNDILDIRVVGQFFDQFATSVDAKLCSWSKSLCEESGIFYESFFFHGNWRFITFNVMLVIVLILLRLLLWRVNENPRISVQVVD